MIFNKEMHPFLEAAHYMTGSFVNIDGTPHEPLGTLLKLSKHSIPSNHVRKKVDEEAKMCLGKHKNRRYRNMREDKIAAFL